MDSTAFIIALVVGVVFVIVAFMLSMIGAKKKKQTLKNIIQERGVSYAASENLEIKQKQKIPSLNGSISKKLKYSGGDIPADGLAPKSIRYLIIQAGLTTPVYRFWIYSVLSCIACFGLAKLFNMSPVSVIFITFTGFFGLPRYILNRMVKRRQQKFLEEFADCIEGMIRLLKSGMPMSEAIVMTAREFTGPIGQEMSKVYEAQRVGDTMPEAVAKLAFRVPIPEVKMFATAVTIQTQTGSSLSEVLQNLSNVIRQRFRLKRKVQALSSEAKISAVIIGCLPLVVIVSLYLLNRDYIELLWITNTGKTLTYISLAWMSVGVFMMKQMINFKV